jgi:LysM repeat protein
VKQGDTLENIASQFNLSLAELVGANPQILTEGLQLTIPSSAGGIVDDTVDTDTDKTGTLQDDTAPVNGSITYTVRPGDTLTAIAAQFNSSVPAIAAANNIANPDLISVGQVLTIPRG